jgi:hypothetical protein
MVAVPVGMCGWTPSVSHPILFAAKWMHFSASGPSFSCVYSSEPPVAGSTTAWAVQYAWAGNGTGWTGMVGVGGAVMVVIRLAVCLLMTVCPCVEVL